jgi:hypothetical protein
MIPKRPSLEKKAPGLLLVLAALVLSVAPVSSLIAEPGAREAGEITGIAYSSGNTTGVIQIVTLFLNTGSEHLTGLVNTVTLHGAGGEVLARATIPCSEEMLIPGQEAMCIADLGSGISAGAVMLKTTVQKQDGTILASEEDQLREGDMAGVDPTPSVSAPGFGACLEVLAVVVLTRRMKRPPATRIILRSAGTGL